MKRSLVSQIVIALLALGIGIGIFLYNDRTLKRFFRNTLETRGALQTLQANIYAVKGEILQNASFLYYSYDHLNRLITETEQTLQRLRSSLQLHLPLYEASLRSVDDLYDSFETFSRKVQRFLTLNASLKNSIIYIPTLQLRAYRLFDGRNPHDRDAMLLLSRIDATIFLARNAQDTDFLPELKHYRSSLEELIPKYQGGQRRLLSTYKQHLDQFLRGFADYTLTLRELLHDPLYQRIPQEIRLFQESSGRELYMLTQQGQLLLILYFLALAILFFIMIRGYQENLYLRRLKEELEEALMTDPLTGLGSRYAYRIRKRTLPQPVLLLINIDRFKYINEYYGTHVGDQTLTGLAKALQELAPPELAATLYRMGGDDFGLLFDKTDLPHPPIHYLKECYNRLRHTPIQAGDFQIELDYTLGASDKREWLFETADMALKAAKSSPGTHYMFYTPELDKRREIARNIRMLHQIREAIETESLVPYFQPIYDRRLKRITKFEALARIELDGGREVLHPYSFIHAATEAKLSGEITLKILRRTLEVAQRNPYDFSVNITAGNILDPDDREEILDLLNRYRGCARQIVFEILESEEFRDYEGIADFIRTVKRFGCRIAIDDFGSGYSNFEKILKLDIDLLKIDGSLIKKIDHDRHAELIVQTILEFARHAGWKTVAEFVHSKAVFDKTSEMGFDMLQGYYLGKPAKGLQTETLI